MTRYAPHLPLPPYAFAPGRTPHPTRHPDGHSYGRELQPRYVAADDWRDSELYLWGIDLFNAGYPWEAHEAWEALWVGCGERRDAVQETFLQGLIQCAAAVVKRSVEQPDAAARLAARATARLRAGPESYMGLRAHVFADAFERAVRSGDELPRLELS